MTARLAALGLLFAVSLAPTGARAQTLENARRLYLAASFQDAVPAFEAVLADGDASRGEILEAHRHLAALHEIQGAGERALVHARAAVALEPDASAPDGAPPEVDALLERAREELGGPAELAIDTPDGALAYEEPGRVRAHLDPAPDGLAARVHLSCDGGDDDRAAASAAPPEVTAALTPRAGSVRCEASASTAAGAVLFEVTRTLSVENAPADATLAVGAHTDDGGDGAPIWPWLAAGAGALVLAGAVVLIVLASQPDQASFGGARTDGW